MTLPLLSAFTALTGVVLGWSLTLITKWWDEQRINKKKLNKLLFFFLELRYYITREYNLKVHLENSIASLIKQVATEEEQVSKEFIKSAIRHLLDSSMFDSFRESGYSNGSRLSFLTENLDNTIVDLSEFLPITAYELTGQYDVKSQLQGFELINKNLPEETNKPVQSIKDILATKLNKDLLDELAVSIDEISKKIGKKTRKEAQEKVLIMDSIDSDDEDSYKFTQFFMELINSSNR